MHCTGRRAAQISYLFIISKALPPYYGALNETCSGRDTEGVMPSIEIVCLGQQEPVSFDYAPFPVEAETSLISHRGSSSLFQGDFDRMQGCIYHLGGPCLLFPLERRRYAYTAADLCSEWWDIIHFKPRYALYVATILGQLLSASPEQKLFFTSDYQFGPRVRRLQRPLTLRAFWHRHDTMKLRTNTACWIVDEQAHPVKKNTRNN